MPKASPIIRSCNAGEFSELLSGRTDIDKYHASMRLMQNYIAAPQGPAICRSGTTYATPIADEAEHSRIIDFVFSDRQALVVELADDRIRFISEAGLLTQTPVAATNVVDAFVKLDAPGHASAVGDQVVFSDYPASYNLNGDTANVTAVAADVITTDRLVPTVFTATGNVALVYSVACDYTEAERSKLQYTQSADVMYLFSKTKQTKKLARYDTYDWRLTEVSYIDGPYLDTNQTTTLMTPTSTGNAVPNMTNDTTPTGVCLASGNRPAISGTKATPVVFLERDIGYGLDVSLAYLGFDDDENTYWAGDTAQEGTLQYDAGSGNDFICDGYTIYLAKENKDLNYTALDYAPSTFRLEGSNDGATWFMLDTQEDYVLYENGKSVFITLEGNSTSYRYHRLNIKRLYRNGLIEPRVRRLVLRDKTLSAVTINASSTTGINGDAGFKSTDVGRVMRLRGSEGAWRWCTIASYVSTTQITVNLKSEPFLNLDSIREWRLGYWSDTTGWPSTGEFFEDRLWPCGSADAPDVFAGSVTGLYEDFTPTDEYGTVLDEHAVVYRLASRKLADIVWVTSDNRGLILGTGSAEYTLSTGSGDPITARSGLRARVSERKGSTPDVAPVQTGDQTLFVQNGGRVLRDLSYDFNTSGYKAVSLTRLASHMGIVPFVEMVYAADPHGIVWIRRSDGSLVGMTYDQDDGIVGWHRHDLAGGKVLSMAVIPQADGLQDNLWLVVERTVNSVTRRYIELLSAFWDFDTLIEDAHYVDCALRYTGSSTDTFYGLQHLEGEVLYGLADEKPVGPLTVTDGKLVIPLDAERVILGLGYVGLGVLHRLDSGAADGTAQGKTKRVHSIVANLWRSFHGELGLYNVQEAEKGNDGFVFERVTYSGDNSEIQEIALFSGMTDPIQPVEGYDKEGIMAFRKPKGDTLPFNIVALMPQLKTEDR